MPRAETTKHMACGKCMWWEVFEGCERKNWGWCKRFPPSIHPAASGDCEPEADSGCWPMTSETEWCGEFRPIFDPPCQPTGTGSGGLTADDLHELKGR